MFQPATMGKQQTSQRRTKKSVMKAPKDFTDPAAAPKGHAAKQRKWTMLGLHRLRAHKVLAILAAMVFSLPLLQTFGPCGAL